MLKHNNVVVFEGMSRKQIEDRKGHDLLVESRETLTPASHRKAAGFSIANVLANNGKHKGF